jgi:hypothetical protein
VLSFPDELSCSGVDSLGVSISLEVPSDEVGGSLVVPSDEVDDEVDDEDEVSEELGVVDDTSLSSEEAVPVMVVKFEGVVPFL